MANKKTAQKFQKREEEFDQKVIDIARVTRVMAGGKRMRFRACLAIGDKKGRVGMGVAKGQDVTLAIQKAFTKAKKNIITVPMINGTIPHQVDVKFKAAKLKIKPAKEGSGIKAGGAVRNIFELAGIGNITGKIMGSNNKINNVKAALLALGSLRAPRVKGKSSPEQSDEKEMEADEKAITNEKSDVSHNNNTGDEKNEEK
jgi:small subunit ribosomal protein S5